MTAGGDGYCRDRKCPADELRRAAEERLQEQGAEGRFRPGSDAGRSGEALVEELRIHQVELELQNEELRESQQRLVESLERYADLYDHAPVGDITVQRDGRVDEANLTVCRLLGVQRRHLIGQSFVAFVTASSQNLLLEHVRQVIDGGRESRFLEVEVQGRDGGVRVVQVSSRQDLGTVARPGRRCRCVLLDVTEQRQAERALAVSESRYRAIFDTVAVGIGVTDISGRWREVNDRACGILGRDATTLTAMSDMDVIHERDRPRARALLRCVVTGEREWGRAEIRCVRPDAATVWVELFITAIRGRDGNAVQLMHALVDVSERRKAQAGIERLVAALEQTVEMVVITDREGVVRYVNAAFEAVSGYASREVVGQHINRLPGSMEQKGVSAEVWQTLKSGSVWRGRLRSRAADGTWYEEEAVMSPVRDADGQITGFVAVKRDVTEQLRIQARLQQAQRLEAIGTLAGGVAHEINNPINGIINYAQLVQEKLDAPSELVQTCLQGIRDEGWRIAAIVRNLLRFAHEDAGRGAFAECGVGELVTRAVSLMETVMRHEHIQIGLDVPVEMPPVLCREQQIQQVLVNLLTNARDALNERFPEPDVDKRLEVACSSEVRDKETWVVITVSDWGAGVPEHVCEHLFEPFFTTKPPGVGTGLGLAITHAIVRDHGGEIGVESAPDGPTRFRVHLPVAGPSDTFHSGDVRG